MSRLRVRAVNMVKEGKTVSETARYFGYSKSAVSKWCKKMPQGRFRVIPTLFSRPHHHPKSEEVVRYWFRQFRLHLPYFEPISEGKVQMDEAYFKSLSLILARQEKSKKLAHRIIFKNSVNKTEATRFLYQYVKPKSTLQTDGSGIYKDIGQWWQVKHKKDIHRKWKFGLTSEIKGMFGNLRTFIRRMYHHVTPEYMPEIVSEFCVRFSSQEIFESPLSYLENTLKPVPFD